MMMMMMMMMMMTVMLMMLMMVATNLVPSWDGGPEFPLMWCVPLCASHTTLQVQVEASYVARLPVGCKRLEF
eukprot:5571989-Amphidinium_carterae.1